MPPQKQEFFSQTDDSSLEPAGCVMQLEGKGGHAGGVHRDQCHPQSPGPELGLELPSQGWSWGWNWGWSCPPRAGAGAGTALPGLESAALGRDSRADTGLGLCPSTPLAKPGPIPVPTKNSCAPGRTRCQCQSCLPLVCTEPSLQTAVGAGF